MATKWKNKSITLMWALLITICFSGIITMVSSGINYYHDYYHTPAFQSQLDEFASYLTLFELNQLSLEDAKNSITVTDQELKNYRTLYNNQDDEIGRIKDLYGKLIEEASAADNKEAVSKYEEERDQKIYETSIHFNDDTYVKEKITQQKEEKIEAFFSERERYRSNFLRLKKEFTYQLTDNVTGKTYTNVDPSGSKLNSKEMLFTTEYTMPKDYYFDFGTIGISDGIQSILSNSGTFDGEIGVAKGLPSNSVIMTNLKNFKQDQRVLLIYTIVTILLLVMAGLLNERKSLSIDTGRWKPLFNKAPLDVNIILFVISTIGATTFTIILSTEVLNINDNPIISGVDAALYLASATLLWGISLLLGKLLKEEFKGWPKVKLRLQKGVFAKIGYGVGVLLKKGKENFSEAFLEQSTGNQVLSVILAFFLLGTAGIMVTSDPFFGFIYVILLAIAGIPLCVVVVKHIGYFNRIMEKTSELAAGAHGKSLQITGKSVLANLAENINQLEQGVRNSQSEQAKSERLKTELITNVSHDLRTPLTSIITYTELLKQESLATEDQAVYIDIIDRKSKRLKVLIDDLFEVSKMASGNMELTKERVNLNQLLDQALGEYNDLIRTSSLTFRVMKDEKPIYAYVDGQKLWRVFDNLIENTLKYSLENTRVYISVIVEETWVSVVFKNVSKY